MRQFVSIHTHIISVVKTILIRDEKVSKNCCRSVFHRPIHKVLHHNLTVASPRVRISCFIFEKLNNLFSVKTGELQCIIFILRVVPELNRGATAGLCLLYRKTIDCQHQQITRMWLRHFVVPSFSTVFIVFFLDQFAIR